MKRTTNIKKKKVNSQVENLKIKIMHTANIFYCYTIPNLDKLASV